jgi:hypothetical protein
MAITAQFVATPKVGLVTISTANTSRSMREPSAPAENTVPMVPAPVRLVLAVLMVTKPTLGVATN